jgi:putative membrane protein
MMNLRRFLIILLVVYTLLTSFSVARGFLGQRYLPFFTPLLSLLAFTFALLHASQRIGWRRGLLMLALTFSVSLLFESVGVLTGLVYGPYHYTDRLGPRFLGLVPYLIPIAWFMMMYPAFVIAERATPPRWRLWAWRLTVAAIGGLVMTAWDLAMDPMMVAGGHWVWEVEGAYFGIPLQNFWGWWVTTFVTFGLFTWLGNLAPSTETSPRFDRLAVTSYAVTGLGAIFVDLQTGLGGAALAGLFAMAPWVILGSLHLPGCRHVDL